MNTDGVGPPTEHRVHRPTCSHSPSPSLKHKHATSTGYSPSYPKPSTHPPMRPSFLPHACVHVFVGCSTPKRQTGEAQQARAGPGRTTCLACVGGKKVNVTPCSTVLNAATMHFICLASTQLTLGPAHGQEGWCLCRFCVMVSHLRPCLFFRMCVSSVVLPAPRKPGGFGGSPDMSGKGATQSETVHLSATGTRNTQSRGPGRSTQSALTRHFAASGGAGRRHTRK